MGFLKNIFWLLITNIAIIVMISITTFILGLLGFNVDFTTYSGLLIWSLVVGFSGSFISLFLSKIIAIKSVGGKIVKENTNSEEAWLLAKMDFLARSWNFKIPDLMIYDSPYPNAFATGPSRNNSLIAVSTGLLQNMNKDEIEGVLGHEMAHIGNGDMVRMTLIQGVVNTFVVFASRIIAKIIAQNVDKNLYTVVFFVVNIISQILFGLLASIVVMGFSRKREYRADADSAKIVGSSKMIMALQRLKSLQNKEEVLPEVVNAFGIASGRDSLFSTHPSLENRIKALQGLKLV